MRTPRLVVLLVIPLAVSLLTAPAQAGFEDPHFIASALWTSPDAVQIQGDRGYALFLNGLAIYDLGVPESPTLLGRIEMPGFANQGGDGFAVDGSFVYVARHEHGLRVVDVSDPAQPREIAGYEFSGCDFWDVDLAGGYACVTDAGNRRFLVFDISDPSRPRVTGGVTLPVMPLRVAVDGSHAYVTIGGAGLAIIDIADPGDPWVAAWAEPVSGPLWDVDVSGGIVWCGWSVGSKGRPSDPSGITASDPSGITAYDPSGITAYDVSDPSNPQPIGGWRSPDFVGSVSLQGDRLYIGSRVGCVSILDVSDPWHVTEIGRLATPGQAYDVVVEGGLAWVADGTGGVTTADVTDPAAPVVVGNAWEAGNVCGVTLRPGQAVVTDAFYGIHLVDVQNPADPFLLGRLELSGGPMETDISADHAFVCCGDSGMRVVDLSDPARPQEVGALATVARHVALAGDLACVVASHEDFRVVDVSDPPHPVIVGVCALPEYSFGVATEGSHAYVACLSGGLQIVDLADPTQPVVCGQYLHPGGIYDVIVHKGLAYLSIRGWGHIAIVDVSDPTDVRPLSDFEVGPWADACWLEGSRLYVGTDGVTVADVTDPMSPVVVGHFQSHAGCDVIQVDGPIIYASDNGALMVLGTPAADVPDAPSGEVELAAGGLLLENPLRGATTVRLRLGEPGPLRLEIFDPRGARRASVNGGGPSGGEHAWFFDPRALGLDSGVYFLRAGTERAAWTRRIVLLP